MYPIYIPSKGRAVTAKAPQLLSSCGYPYTLVVEPQEAHLYQQQFPSAPLLVLPANDQGVAYVRNYILNYEAARGGTWYWMLDDDVYGFWEHENGHAHKTTPHVLEKIEATLPEFPTVAQVGMSRRDAAWKLTKPFTRNIGCYIVVCNHAQRIAEVAQYRNEGLFEDGDMCLQILSSGYGTLRWLTYAFRSPFCGTGEGGLHEVYLRKEDAYWVNVMRERWGPEIISSVTKPNGRITLTIHWRYFSDDATRARAHLCAE